MPTASSTGAGENRGTPTGASSSGFAEIDKISPAALSKEDDSEILSLHFRLHQLWGDLEKGAKINREDLVNAHFFVVEEMRRRGFSHFRRSALDDETEALRREAKEKMGERPTLPIFQSGVRNEGEALSLPEILSHYRKPVMLQENAVSLVGGVAIRGFSQNDVDIVLRSFELKSYIRRALFRLHRALPEKMRERVQLLVDDGPFTDYVPLYDLWLVPRADLEVVFMSEDGVDEFMAAPFSVYGGKRFLASKIAPLVPAHKRYVEPFAGAAAVLFARPKPSEEEILADIDPEKIFILECLKKFGEKERARLLTLEWGGSKDYFKKMMNADPRDEVERFHRFMYLTWHSFGKRRDSFAHQTTADPQNYVEKKMPLYRERLKNVRILRMDWKEVVRRFDSKETFFYLDPPYIGTSNDKAQHFTAPSAEELHSVLGRISGKFLLSNNDVRELRDRFSSHRIRSVLVPTRVDNIHKGAKTSRRELVIANFDIPARIVAASEDPGVQSFESVPVPRAASSRLASEARVSAREDRVEPGRFFVMPKPTMGADPNESFTINAFLEFFREEDFPVLSSKKFDGGRHQIHRADGRVSVVSEDGEDHTERVPRIVEAVKRLKGGDLVLDAEIEMWIEGRHQTRETTNGFLKSKGPADDENLVAHVFDIVYAGRDIHDESLEKRLEALAKLGIEQSTNAVPKTGDLNRVPHVTSRSRPELGRHTDMLRRLPGSEGNVAKKHGSPYPLSGSTNDDWIKFRNAGVVTAIVVDRVETKVPGTFNLVIGLPFDETRFRAASKFVMEFRGRPVFVVGKTFSTAKAAVVAGESVRVEFSPLEHGVDKDGRERISLVLPRVLAKSDDAPNSVGEAIRIAKDNFSYARIEDVDRMSEDAEGVLRGSAGIERGLVMKPPFGILIAEGKKTEVVKTRPFAIGNETFWIVEGDFAVGKVRLGTPRRIAFEEFRKSHKAHFIPVENGFYRRSSLWMYPIEKAEALPKPRRIKRPEGPKVLLTEVRFS